MLSFLRRELPAAGRVLYPGAIPPPLDQLSGLRDSVTCAPVRPAVDQLWAAEVAHPAWGQAEIACLRQSQALPDLLIAHTRALSAQEKTDARRGRATVTVRVRALQKQVLRDRKRLLFWLRTLMQPSGAVAIDDGSTLLWSHAMLEDELAHDADLDIESLYVIHGVHGADDTDRVAWLHTHGLEPLGAFDIDVLHPSPLFVNNCSDPIRALAFAGLEGHVGPDATLVTVAHPGGEVRLVPADRYQADASAEHRALRDADAAHSGRRAVVCEPARGLFGRWRSRPAPSRFFSELDTDGFVVPFSDAATSLMAERATQTLGVFRALCDEFARLDLPALVKLGYPTEHDESTEHLWFQMHSIHGDTVEATLVNAPHRVPTLTAGQRGEFGLERLTDWVILSPAGAMTPRNVSAARRLREDAS